MRGRGQELQRRSGQFAHSPRQSPRRIPTHHRRPIPGRERIYGASTTGALIEQPKMKITFAYSLAMVSHFRRPDPCQRASVALPRSHARRAQGVYPPTRFRISIETADREVPDASFFMLGAGPVTWLAEHVGSRVRRRGHMFLCR